MVKEAALINVKATVLSGKATITFDAGLEGRVANEDSNYDERFWEPQAEDPTQKPFNCKPSQILTMYRNSPFY